MLLSLGTSSAQQVLLDLQDVLYWHVYPMLCNSACGPEIGLDFGRILVGTASKSSSGRPKAGPRADFEAFPNRIRPKSGPEDRFSARKHYRVTWDICLGLFIHGLLPTVGSPDGPEGTDTQSKRWAAKRTTGGTGFPFPRVRLDTRNSRFPVGPKNHVFCTQERIAQRQHDDPQHRQLPKSKWLETH